MLESFDIKNKFTYEKLTEEEQTRRGILGRLVGPIADSKNATRNGRRYTAELWEKVFRNPIMQEKIKNRVCFGELGHPADRTEVDIEKICWCLAEIPKKGTDGQLYGVFDILPTPNGKILKALCDYGSNIGTSSRGNGDVYFNDFGEELVDPDTYECECWDAVLLPAVESARLTPVTESLQPKKTLQESLQSLVETASEDDRRVMNETLQSLNLVNNCNTVVDNHIAKDGDVLAADYAGALTENLQVALREKKELEKQVLALQEQLSVGYTKETALQEQVLSYSKTITQLTNNAAQNKALQNKIKSLQEELKREKDSKQELQDECTNAKKVYKNELALKEELNNSVESKEQEITQLKESLQEQQNQYDKLLQEKNSLVEEVSKLNKAIEKKRNEYVQQLNSRNKLVEKYKKIANTAADKYICSQADKLGVQPSEIKSKLSKSYTFNEIDSICEDLQNYKLKLNRIPFSTNRINEGVSVKVKSSKSESILANQLSTDDEIDEMLKQFI